MLSRSPQSHFFSFLMATVVQGERRVELARTMLSRRPQSLSFPKRWQSYDLFPATQLQSSFRVLKFLLHNANDARNKCRVMLALALPYEKE